MGKGTQPPPDVDDLPTEDDYSSANERAPVLWFRGTRLVPGQWLTDALDEHKEQAPDNNTGKK